jgi:hypothetical protein
LPASEANLAAAQSKLNEDRDRLDQMMKAREKEFEASPEYAKANKDVADALAADRSAKDAVLGKLKQDPTYQLAKKRAEAADLAAKGDPSKAAAAMDADGAVSKLENSAYASDDGVKAADVKLKTAQEALKHLKDQQAAKLASDQRLSKMRGAIEQDQTQVDAWAARVKELKK